MRPTFWCFAPCVSAALVSSLTSSQCPAAITGAPNKDRWAAHIQKITEEEKIERNERDTTHKRRER